MAEEEGEDSEAKPSDDSSDAVETPETLGTPRNPLGTPFIFAQETPPCFDKCKWRAVHGAPIHWHAHGVWKAFSVKLKAMAFSWSLSLPHGICGAEPLQENK